MQLWNPVLIASWNIGVFYWQCIIGIFRNRRRLGECFNISVDYSCWDNQEKVSQ